MNEEKIYGLLQQGRALARVTIIDKSGSAPRMPGAAMVVMEDSTCLGTIGGGRLEQTVRQSARQVAAGAPALLTRFDMRGSGAPDDPAMVCGGDQLIFIERLHPGQADLFRRAADCRAAGGRGLWILDISDPRQPQRTFVDLRQDRLQLDGVDPGDIFRQRGTRMIRTPDNRTLVLEPVISRGTVVFIGGGHVAGETAGLAVLVDFQVVVADDRADFCTAKRFPMARSTHHVPEFDRLFDTVPGHEDAYLLIMTHAHGLDQHALAQALRTRARYIGMIGSRRKRSVIYGNLKKQGFTDEDLARVHCPVGLEIGSETPAEIAVSILAQLIAARAGILSSPHGRSL